MENTSLSNFIRKAENNYCQSINRLRNSEEKGLKGHLIRHIASRVVAVALPIFATSMLVLKVGVGVHGLISGTFHTICDNQKDITVFSKKIAKNYFSSLGRSTLGVILGAPAALIDPNLTKFLLKTESPQIFTDNIIPRIGQDVSDKIYDILQATDEALRNQDVSYILDGGTLLGAVRHGGFIPWDDDGDIAILEKEHDKFIAAAAELKLKGFTIAKFWTGYKIFPTDGKEQQDAEVYNPDTGKWESGKIRFPFIDVFVMEKEDDRYIIGDRFPESKKMWPNEYFSDEEWNNITDVSFGHLQLRGLTKEHAKDYLVRDYGEDWETVAYRFYDHELERGVRPIKVDLLDHTHPVRSIDTPQTRINHKAIAQEALATMSEEERDRNWQLNNFFGSVRVINLDRDIARMNKAKASAKAVGLDESQLERFRGCNGRETLPEDKWSRMDSNYKKISTKTVDGRERLDNQHKGQTGCYMSHYRVIKETADNYDQAKKELLQLKKDPSATPQQIKIAEAKVKKYSNVLILEDDNEFGMILPENVTAKGWGKQVYSDTLTKEGVGTVFYEAMRDLPEDWDMLYFMAQSYQEPTETESPRLRKLKKASCLNAYAVNARMYPRLLQQLRKIEHHTQSFKPVDEEIARLHIKSNSYVICPGIAVQPGEDSVINNVRQKDPQKKYWQCLTV